MADNRYGDQGRREDWRGSSIFSDDDDLRRRESGCWSGEPSRERDDERGFFDRAGDEVRSWFGDEEAERRRERDIRRDDARSAFSGFGGREARRGFYRGSEYGEAGSRLGSEPAWGREEGVHGQMPVRERDHGGRAQWDDNYRRWRDRQIEQFDRDYDDYCRERQQAFEKDFDSWRTSRLAQGGLPSGAVGQNRGQTMEGGSAETATTGASATGAAIGSSKTTTVAPGRSRGSRSGS